MKLKLLILAVLIGLGTMAYSYRDSARDWLSGYLGDSEEEPVPTIRMKARDYRIVVPAAGELTGLEMIPVAAPRLRGGGRLKIGWIAEEGFIAKVGDVLVRFDSSDLQLSLEKNQNTVSSFGHQIKRSEFDAESQSQILVMDREEADLELDFANSQVRRDEAIFSQWEIHESVVSAALASFKKDAIDVKGSVREKVSAADLDILKIEQTRALSEVDIAKEALSSLELKAASEGVVIYSRNGFSSVEVGANVWPGFPILQLASLFQFQGELFVAENEISGVAKGLPVELELSSFPGRTFMGSIKSVARVPQQRSRNDPRKFFICNVVLEVPLDVMRQLKPGMRVLGRVEIRSRNAAFVAPKNAVIKKDGEVYVYVKQGEDFTQKTVKILDSDHGFYILEGVEDGDEVAMRNPFEEMELHLPDFNAPSTATQSRRFIIVG